MNNPINDSEWAKDENWGGGSIYFSKKDTRTWVPKRHKWMGWTLNLAHTSGVAWMIVIIIFLALFPVVLVSILSSFGIN